MPSCFVFRFLQNGIEKVPEEVFLRHFFHSFFSYFSEEKVSQEQEF